MILLTSCIEDNKKDARIAELQSQIDSASHSLSARDSVLSGYLEFAASIENNLNEIRKRESMLSLDREDFNASSKEVRDKMVADLATINKLMDDNRQKIAVLSQKLKGSRDQIDQLRNLVQELKQNMEEREAEVQKLNQQVAELTNDNHTLKIRNDSLFANGMSMKDMIDRQNETITSLGTHSSTAYYAAGPANELEKKNIIAREGGFLGIGAVEHLNDNVELSSLKYIDIRQTFSIPIKSKKAEIITNHPKDSYKLVVDEKDRKIIDQLKILDPQKFWESSKCLVVVTK